MQNGSVLEGFLAAVGRQTGLDLGFDDDNRCTLRCRDGLVCEIAAFPESGTVLLTAVLGRPGGESEMRRCLELNLDLRATRGCTIAFDPRRAALVLQWLGEADALDHAGFAARLGGLIQVAGAIAARLREPDAERNAPAETAAPPTDWTFVRA